MKKCNNCGTMLEDEALFCSECGAKQEPAEKKCHNCGAVLPEGAKFCMNCGTPVAQAAATHTPTPSPEIQESASFEVSQPDENTLSFNVKGVSFNMKFIKGGMLGKDEVSDFYIGETVVTQALWQTVTGNNPSEDNSDIHYPVTDIDSKSIKAFLTRLKKIIGTTFDIPTGTQFKYAALKGCEKMSKAEFDEMMWGDCEWHPVCGLMSNHFGLYDLRDLYQAVQDAVPVKKDNYYRFNPKYKEGEYGALLKSLKEVDFDEGSTTLRLVLNIPVDPKLEKIMKDKEKREALKYATERSFLFKVCRKDKYGFIDRSGEIVVPCKYDHVQDFREDIAIVQKGDKYGCINKKGEEVVTCKYDRMESFHEGMAAVRKKGNNFGFINKNGREVVPCKYDRVRDFHEGMAAVQKGNFDGYIDKTGKEVIPLKYFGAYDFHDGLARVQGDSKQKYRFGFIDKTGREVIPYRYKDAGDFQEGMAMVKNDTDKYGFIDKTGREVVPCKYKAASDFCDGLARVRSGEKYGFVDKTGKEVIPCDYDYVHDFHEGLALIRVDDRYGYIDKTGKMVIRCKYSDALDFSEGLACVAKDGKFGYIDKAGNEVIPCKFEYDSDDDLGLWADSFRDGLAYLVDDDDDKCGYIDTTGTKIDIIGLDFN